MLAEPDLSDPERFCSPVADDLDFSFSGLCRPAEDEAQAFAVPAEARDVFPLELNVSLSLGRDLGMEGNCDGPPVAVRSEPVASRSVDGQGEAVVQSQTQPQLQNKQEPTQEHEAQRRSSKNRKFTPEEDERLRELVKAFGEGCWTRVADKMPGRNRKQVRERYVNFVKKERSSREFTAEEDALILNFVQTRGRKWIVISDMLPGRTPIMIKNRYYAKLRHAPRTQTKSTEAIAAAVAKAQNLAQESHVPAVQCLGPVVTPPVENSTIGDTGIEEVQLSDNNKCAEPPANINNGEGARGFMNS